MAAIDHSFWSAKLEMVPRALLWLPTPRLDIAFVTQLSQRHLRIAFVMQTSETPLQLPQAYRTDTFVMGKFAGPIGETKA